MPFKYFRIHRTVLCSTEKAQLWWGFLYAIKEILSAGECDKGRSDRASKELSGNARRHYAPDIVRCFKQVSTHARVFADVIHMGNIMSASLLI